MAALCAEAVLDPREDFPAWLGAHGVSARVLEAVEAELGIGDYEALLACAAQAPVRAELLAAAKERLPFAFYAALRRVAEQVGRGCGGGGGHHDGSTDALALHPFLGSLLDTIVRMLSNLSRELSHSAERFRLLDAAAFYGHGGGGGADDDRDTRLSSPGHSVQDADGYGEDGAEASALDMDEDGMAPDGAAVVRWSRGVSSAGLHDGALQPPDPHVAAVGAAAGGAGEAEADDAAGAAEAWRAASVKTEPLHEGEKAAAGAAEGSLACELDEASAFCQGAVETQDDDDYDNDDDDIDDNDDGGGGGATPGRVPRWGSLERGAASWAERGHEPPDRWPGNFHPKLESSEGHGSDGAFAQQHSPPPPLPPPRSWQTADVTAAPRLDHTTERSRGQQPQQQLPAERFVRSDAECEGPACRAAYARVYDDNDDVVVVTDEQLAHGGGGYSPRVCPDCGMSFRTPSKLCRHRQSRHSEQKPYVCDECGKRFSLIHNLNQHRRIHSGEKPFVCEECGMTFGRKYHLDRHKKTHSIH
ncbi:unnamed protein product [Lampetra fluviatilis]